MHLKTCIIKTMKNVVFVTGSQDKADYLAKLLGISIEHQKIELDEIQSLDLHEIVEHKVKQAYAIIQKPVLVEDVSLEFKALHGLPGPFIKYFVDTAGLEATCRMLDGFSDRSAVAKCTFGYYDGNTLELFDGSLGGTIAESPRGERGYGWDKILIHEEYGERTRAELTQEENEETYQIIKPLDQLRKFLQTI